MVLAIRPVVVLLFAVVVLLFAMVLLLIAVAVMMMIGLLLLLFLFASRVVGCRRHPLLPTTVPDSPPRGRTMTRSASRAASRGSSLKAAADNVKTVAAAAAAHYQPLDAEYTDSVRAQSVSRRGYSGSSPDFSSSRLGRASAKRDKVSNATMAVATLGVASGSAAGHQVSNRVLEVVSRGGEVLLEVVQAVVKTLG